MRVPQHRGSTRSPDGPHAGGSMEHSIDDKSYKLAKEVRDLLPSLFTKKPRKTKKPDYLRRVDPEDFRE